jgi:hypothetical protein
MVSEQNYRKHYGIGYSVIITDFIKYMDLAVVMHNLGLV